LNKGLSDHLMQPLAWVEDPAAPYFTDRPGHDAFAALILWAAYDEQPSLRVPTRTPSDYGKDPAYVASNAEGFRSRYGQLLHEVEIWLPATFSFTFRGAHLGQGDVGLGSTHGLLEQLHELNDRTWRLKPGDLGAILQAGVERGAPLDAAARFGYSIVEKLAGVAVEVHLPMKLDY
jgi:hypothetical protein